MFDLVFITHIPAFYKINLYNEISNNKDIFVVFIASNTASKRSEDFINIERAKFDYVVVNEGAFENRNAFISSIKLLRIMFNLKAKKFVVSGWDLHEFWLAWCIVRKKNLCLALESTIYESSINGLKSAAKKIFLSRVSRVFASGALHKELLLALNYSGDIKITKGVGIIRKGNSTSVKTKAIKNKVVYIGRLSEEKNLVNTISVFNKFPNLKLDLYGDGPLKELIESSAPANVAVKGTVLNSNLPEVFAEADFLLLPSASETWGLVIEEALYYSVPVLVSNRCGAIEIVSDNGCSITFNHFDESLEEILMNYDSLASSTLGSHDLGCNFINKKDLEQVNVYLQF